MLKIKSILVSLLAVAALASCSNENLEENPEVEGGAGYDVAYVSISLTNPKVPGSRASGEQTALEEESAINELYLITFNASKVVTKDEKATKYATVLGSSSFGTNNGVTTPNTPVKVDPNTKYLLVIANPGYQLKDRLDNLSAGATYTTINGMITVPENNTKPNNAYLVEEVVHSKGCAMINVGFYDDSDSDPSNHAWEDECLLDVSDKIVLVSDYKSEAQAQNAAKSNPATLEIERLAAKLEVMIGGSLEVGPFEDGTNASLGQFDFGNWTIDYYNSLFYPLQRRLPQHRLILPDSTKVTSIQSTRTLRLRVEPNILQALLRIHSMLQLANLRWNGLLKVRLQVIITNTVSRIRWPQDIRSSVRLRVWYLRDSMHLGSLVNLL